MSPEKGTTARPVARVVMPASQSRPEPSALLPCGQHYWITQPAPQAVGDTVYNRQSVLITGSVGRRQPGLHQATTAA